MKYLPSTLLLGLLAFTLRAQTPAPAPATPSDPFVKKPGDAAAKEKPDWRSCFFVLEVYALDKNDARSVIESDGGNAARYQRVAELAKAGKARLDTLTALASKNGQRAVIQGIDEVRYPTEFSPPSDDKSIAGPSAWETRNAGDTLELEPVIMADGRTCDVNLMLQRVCLNSMRDTVGAVGDALTSQPVFHNQTLATAVAASGSEPFFLGTYTPAPAKPDDATSGEVWLAFLHANIQDPNDAKSSPKANQFGPLHLEYSIYSLDRALALDLLTAPSPASAAWEKLQALLGEKKARFEHLTTITTKLGQRAATEETREERYWTEGTRPSRPAAAVERTEHTTVTEPTPDPTQTTKKDFSKSVTATETTTVTWDDVHSPRIPGYASAFETRNTGVSVEVEPTVSPDGQTVEVNQAVSETVLLGSLKGTGVAEKYPWQPLFEARKLRSTQTLPIGVHVLAGTLNPPGADGVNDRTDPGRTWVLFVRALPNEP